MGSLFVEVFNLLNADDLRVITYQPNPSSALDLTNPSFGNGLQVDGQRRFGRRFQIGLQLEF